MCWAVTDEMTGSRSGVLIHVDFFPTEPTLLILFWRQWGKGEGGGREGAWVHCMLHRDATLSSCLHPGSGRRVSSKFSGQEVNCISAPPALPFIKKPVLCSHVKEPPPFHAPFPSSAPLHNKMAAHSLAFLHRVSVVSFLCHVPCTPLLCYFTPMVGVAWAEGAGFLWEGPGAPWARVEEASSCFSVQGPWANGYLPRKKDLLRPGK